MNQVTKTDLVASIAKETEQTQKTVLAVIDALFEEFAKNAAAGRKVMIPGWLSVERAQRAARVGRNPRTREEIKIPATYVVRLTAGSKLKAAVKK